MNSSPSKDSPFSAIATFSAQVGPHGNVSFVHGRTKEIYSLELDEVQRGKLNVHFKECANGQQTFQFKLFYRIVGSFSPKAHVYEDEFEIAGVERINRLSRQSLSLRKV